MEFLSQHKMVIIVVVILVLGVAWYGLYGNSGSDAILSNDTPTSANDPGQALVQTLLAVRAISLSSTIFSTAAFTGLQDFSTQIVSEPVGRQNPFAPLLSREQQTSVSAASSSLDSTKLFGPRR